MIQQLQAWEEPLAVDFKNIENLYPFESTQYTMSHIPGVLAYGSSDKAISAQNRYIRRYALQPPALPVPVTKAGLSISQSGVPDSNDTTDKVFRRAIYELIRRLLYTPDETSILPSVLLYPSPWSLAWTFKFISIVTWANLNLIKSSLKWFQSALRRIRTRWCKLSLSLSLYYITARILNFWPNLVLKFSQTWCWFNKSSG